ncbi:MAG: hypothetical protein HS114_10630 [Anaerolineales bacterium]|nr:hypothetical protein [Anaerolineales bacterium]
MINRDRVDASMRSKLKADYGFDPALALAPLSEEIIAEAEQDEAALLARQTPIAVGLGIAILPNPLPTPAPTAITLLPTPTPTPTPAPSSNPAPALPTPAAPTATQEVPPTSPPSTVTSAPPTISPPTVPATVPPTVPATVPPTMPPPTPATVPPTIPATVLPTIPATVAPSTVTATPTNTATPTDTPTATATATHTPTSTPIPPTVAFSAATFNINENGGNAVITVLLSASSTQTVTVNYASLVGGTATLAGDYTPVSGSLIFSPGQTSQTFNVPVINDAVNEGDETVLLHLSTPVNATLGLSDATLIIIEDDPPPSVQFSSGNYNMTEANTTIPIDVTLSIASALTITVDYATSENTATAGQDYTDTSGNLTFAPGQTNQTFSVQIINDNLQEPDETVSLRLSNPTNAGLGPTNPATLTISDDGDTGGCAGSSTSGQPNIGPPDGQRVNIACGSAIVVDLGSTPIDTTTPDTNPDFVFYELGQPNPPITVTFIFMDWTIVKVGTASGLWYEVFNWGDNVILDDNSNIGQAGYGPPNEDDNLVIPVTNLYGTAPYTTGITIDIDARAPAGIYQYIRIESPPNGANDPPEVDAIEILP